MSTPHPGIEEDDFPRLLAEAQSASAEALGSLLEPWREHLKAVARRRLRPDLQARQDDEDFVQNAFPEAAAQIAAFNGTHPHVFGAWLRSLLVHDLQDFFRAHRTRESRRIDREITLDSLSPSQREMLTCAGAREIHRVAGQVIERLLTELTPTDREIVCSHCVEGAAFRKIGEQLGMSANAVRKRCARALAVLAQLPLPGELDGEEP